MRKVKRFLWVIGLMLSTNFLSAQEKLTVSLKDLFSLADQNNRQLQLLSNNEKIAQEAIKEEKQKLLPNINASLMLSYNGDGYITDRDFSHGFSIDIPKIGNNFILEAKQLIYGGGAVKTTIEMANTNLTLSQLETETNRQNLRFGITGYYLELLKLKNQRQILVKNIEQTKKLIDQIKAREKQGVALKNNITRYELQRQSQDVGLLKLDNTLTILSNELVKIVKLPVGTVLEIDEVDLASFAANEDQAITDWTDLASENATVLKTSNLQIEQALRGEKLAKTEKLPQVFAFAGNYFNGPVMIEIPVLNNNFNYWNVGVGVSYNISSLYKTKTKQNQAKLSVLNAQENQNIVKEQLNNDIEAAKIRFEETKKVYQTHLKGVELANQNYTVIRNRYVNDMALTTEMLDAENTKIDAELQSANSQINILFQYYQLKKLTGIL